MRKNLLYPENPNLGNNVVLENRWVGLSNRHEPPQLRQSERRISQGQPVPKYNSPWAFTSPLWDGKLSKLLLISKLQCSLFSWSQHPVAIRENTSYAWLQGSALVENCPNDLDYQNNIKQKQNGLISNWTEMAPQSVIITIPILLPRKQYNYSLC